MKVTIKEAEQKKEEQRKYPYLGTYKESGLIVLFYKPTKGVVIKNTYFFEMGQHVSFPSMEEIFELFEGSIEISND